MGQSAKHPSNGSPTSETARLLVADDDPQIRNVTVRLLKRCGYDVTAVEDGPRNNFV